MNLVLPVSCLSHNESYRLFIMTFRLMVQLYHCQPGLCLFGCTCLSYTWDPELLGSPTRCPSWAYQLGLCLLERGPSLDQRVQTDTGWPVLAGPTAAPSLLQKAVLNTFHSPQVPHTGWNTALTFSKAQHHYFEKQDAISTTRLAITAEAQSIFQSHCAPTF